MTDGDIVLSVDLSADDAIATSEQLTEKIRQIFSSAGEDTPVGFKKLQVAMDKAVTQAQQLSSQLLELQNTEFATPEYTDIENQLSAVEQKYEQVNQQRKNLEAGGKINTSKYKELESALEALYNKAENLRQAKEEMEQNGTAFISGEETEEYSNIAQKLNQVNNQMVVLRQRALEFGENGEQSAQRTSRAYSNLNRTSKNLSSTLQKVVAQIKKIGSSAISAGIKKLKGNFSGLGKSSDDTTKALQKGFKTLIKYAFGVRSFFFLYRKIRKAVSEGFGNLAQVNEPFNRVMSDMMTALNLLKNTVAAAFAPLVETVGPILTQFINNLAEAISKVGQFIASLTGKEYIKAGTAYVDYAQSLDKSSKSSSKATNQTKKQTEAQKKLNREITHFDDLVILHEKHENENTTPNTNTTTPTATFTNAPIGDAISQFAKDFKAAWAKADFTDIGRQLGEKLKNMLEHLPWEKIQAGTRKVAKSIATFLNGFLETPGLFTEIGETVGEAINTALAGLSTFAWNFHWGSLGTAISDAMKATLSTINWDDAYSAAEGFGKGYAEYLNNLITPETFGLIGTTLANVLNTVFKFLAKFGTMFDWTNFGVSLATGLNKFLENLNIDDFKRGVHAFVYGIRDSIVAFLDEADWYKFGTTLRDVIEAIPWTTILTSFGEIIWYAIKAVIQLAKGIFTGDNTVGKPVVEAFEKLQDTVDDIAENVDFESLAKGFKDIVDALKPAAEGFAVGLLNFFSTIIEMGEKLLNAIGPALQAIADALNDMDPAILQGIGVALGVIAGALITMNLAKGVAGILSGLVTPLANLATNASNAAAALGTGSAAAGGTGLVGSLFMAASGVGAFLWALDEFKETTPDTKTELSDLTKNFDDNYSVLEQIAPLYGLTADKVAELANQVGGAQDPHSDMLGTYENINKELEDAGINVDEFKGSLSAACQVAKAQGKDIGDVESYINGVASSSSTATEDTSGFANAFDAFDSLSISTPLKMLLLSTAIKNLGETGVLSKEQVSNLQTTLDEYDANPTEQALNNVKTAFENTGIKADDFNASLAKSMAELPRSTRSEISTALTTISNAGSDFKKEGEKDSQQFGEGYKEGIEKSQDKVNDSIKSFALAGFGAMDTATESHSPSKKAQQRGIWIGEGLKLGLEESASRIYTAAEIVAKNIVSKFNGLESSLRVIGSNAMTGLYNGIQNGATALYTLANSTADGIYNSFNNQGWYQLGDNIGIGIYNGLVADSGWLQTLAWNTAVNMYNAACDALDIASPSKKFAWIGSMLMQGWQNGIVNNSDNAVDAVTDVANAMTDEAEEMNPAVTISTSIDNWIDALDSVLTNFSETVIDRFDNLVQTLAQLGSISTTMPAVAQGRVIPSSIASAANASANNSEMRALLDSMASQQISYDELRSMLIELFTEYMQTNFYLGDEQIARHANNGNLLLNRRYSIIKT